MKKETKSTETKKPISYEIREVTLPLRSRFTDAYYAAEHSSPQKFSLWVECIKIITSLTVDDILALTDIDVVQVCVECLIEIGNKKKVKK